VLATTRFLCDPEERLGHDKMGGAPVIKKHSFLRGVDWGTVRQSEAPFVPELKSITDTSYFPTEELQDIPEAVLTAGNTGGNGGDTSGTMMDGATMAKQKDLAFVGYTFKRFDYLTRRNAL
jgi:protein-serine/threonine kinase